ncbi:MAG: DUF2283 domain-containing protein [Methanobrevibacter sp.]|nr:DUF2283 domain-containing protein [Methanobrevibacter sp.]
MNKMISQESINYTYDPIADALFIKVENYEHETSIQINDNVIMDLNKEKQFIALEILSASHELNTDISSLEEIMNIVLYVKVTDYQIFVNGIFTLAVHDHEEIKVANASILNDINLPNMDTSLATV